MFNVMAIFGLGTGLSVLVWLILVLIFIFEIWMLVDAITRKSLSTTARVWWIIGMILVHPIVAIIYYFTGRKDN